MRGESSHCRFGSCLRVSGTGRCLSSSRPKECRPLGTRCKKKEGTDGGLRNSRGLHPELYDLAPARGLGWAGRAASITVWSSEIG